VRIPGLEGAVAVVTGGSTGIGRACADVLAESGAIVYAVSRTTDPPVDVREPATLASLAEGIAEDHGRLDVLITSAGVLTENRPAHELSIRDFDENYDVNVRGTVNACQALWPLLRGARGAVVCITSQAALVSLPAQAAYSASKGAVAALTRSLAIDWAGAGVRVNGVAPGFTETPMTAGSLGEPRLATAVRRRIPLGRVLAPVEIAHAAVFLASPAASAITGVVLPVDGGWTAGEPALPW
jgi:meso-butanediol dehydrogenase / (S,S)-butanediol dehydrogenase / diacetyl reductase